MDARDGCRQDSPNRDGSELKVDTGRNSLGASDPLKAAKGGAITGRRGFWECVGQPPKSAIERGTPAMVLDFCAGFNTPDEGMPKARQKTCDVHWSLTGCPGCLLRGGFANLDRGPESTFCGCQ